MVDKRLPQAGAYVSAEQRIKKMHYTMITKEFCDTMNEINVIQTSYQVGTHELTHLRDGNWITTLV